MAASAGTLIRREGPIVQHTCMLFQYCPLEPGGLLASMDSWMAFMFSTSFSSGKSARPHRTCKLPDLSKRYSTLPPLNSFTAADTSVVTVPALGLGIRPLGPSTRPSLATLGIMSGVAMSLSNSSQPLVILSTRSSLPNTSAPAALAASRFAPCDSTATRICLPVPWGRETVARSCWSVYLGSRPMRACTSMLSVNLTDAEALARRMASRGSSSVVRVTPILACMALKRLERFFSRLWLLFTTASSSGSSSTSMAAAETTTTGLDIR
mmetsp:Transcript_13783/g.37246  ORF Transcript_13783/g.37246 Transcript_13783/m.37246 type:complete len:267 (+) Transcript_13783:494-1294(+)